MSAALRILVVSHLSPPVAGMTPLHLSRVTEMLAARGHDVDLLTMRAWRGHPIYPQDPDHLRANGVRAVRRTFPGVLHALSTLTTRRSESLSESSGASLGSVVRRAYRGIGKQLLIPDRSVDWLPFALPAAASMQRERSYDVTLSLAYPVTSHLVSWSLRRRCGVRWIGYYLDPWSFSPDTATLPRWRTRVDSALESAMLRDMDLVLVNTDETRDGYLRHFPELADARVRVCGIGYDPVDYIGPPTESPAEGFDLLYTGIFTARRDPAPLIAALDRLPASKPIRLVIAGNVDAAQRQRFAESIAAGRVECLGALPHRDVVRLQRSATALVLMGWTGGYQIPAKLYEYIGARRPIIAIRGDPRDPAARLVKELRRGVALEPNATAITEALAALYDRWRSGQLDSAFDLAERAEYSWQAQLAGIGAAVSDVVRGRTKHSG